MSRFEVAISIMGAFIATLCASFFSYSILEIDGATLILASTGASAMLVFGLPQSPASQPWNLVGGHLVSAFVGVSCHFLLSNEVLASSVAIPLAMLVMHCWRARSV